MKTFADEEAFFADNEERRHSGETDFGVWWKDDVGSNWRVSWVEATGELYAIRLGPTGMTPMIGGVVISAGSNLEGPLVVFGEIERSEGECRCGHSQAYLLHRDECPAYPGHHAERVLEGWADKCGAPESLRWVRERMQRLDPNVILYS